MTRCTLGLFGGSSRWGIAVFAIIATAGVVLLPFVVRTHRAGATGGGSPAQISFSAGTAPAVSPSPAMVGQEVTFRFFVDISGNPLNAGEVSITTNGTIPDGGITFPEGWGETFSGSRIFQRNYTGTFITSDHFEVVVKATFSTCDLGGTVTLNGSATGSSGSTPAEPYTAGVTVNCPPLQVIVTPTSSQFVPACPGSSITAEFTVSDNNGAPLTAAPQLQECMLTFGAGDEDGTIASVTLTLTSGASVTFTPQATSFSPDLGAIIVSQNSWVIMGGNQSPAFRTVVVRGAFAQPGSKTITAAYSIEIGTGESASGSGSVDGTIAVEPLIVTDVLSGDMLSDIDDDPDSPSDSLRLLIDSNRRATVRFRIDCTNPSADVVYPWTLERKNAAGTLVEIDSGELTSGNSLTQTRGNLRPGEYVLTVRRQQGGQQDVMFLRVAQMNAPVVQKVEFIEPTDKTFKSSERERFGDLDKKNPDQFKGGSRIFPDALQKDVEAARKAGTPPKGRNLVRVRAVVKFARPPQPVLFRSFDVDDPSDDMTDLLPIFRSG